MDEALVAAARPEPGVLHLRLDRPAKRNALSTALLAELAGLLARAADEREIRCVILAGDDKAFSAGADIEEMLEGGVEVLRDPGRAASWRTIEIFPKPLIAVVDGVALGAGNELAMLADVIVAGEGASFGQPEVAIGGMPGDGGTQRLARLVGKGAAMRMILTGLPIDARTALALGLVVEVVPAGESGARALELARRIARTAPLAAMAAKRAVLDAFELPLSEGLRREREAMLGLAASRDRKEGLAAFLERRPPVFTGE
jgi:enoyl-CoA hydratase